MACDPNILLEQAKCLNSCIPPQMLSAVQVSLLCQILESGGGGGGGGGVTSFNTRTGAVTLVLSDVTTLVDSRYVLKTGDTMTGPLLISGGTVVANTPLLDISQTWNNGAVAFTGVRLNITSTASAGTSNLIDVQLAGVSQFSVSKSSVTARLTFTSFLGGFTAAAAGSVLWLTRSRITSPADGQLLIANNGISDWGRIMLGGTTSAFPAIKRSAALLQARLADDSAYCDLEARILRMATAFTVATLPAAGTPGRIAYVTDALAPAFLVAVAGGGAVVTPVFDNGAAWVAA